jgi:hypothetical protein
MLWILSYTKYLPALALGIAVGAVPAFYKGKAAQREEMRSEAAVEALNRIQAMEKNNASFSKLSDRDRCLVFMRDSGLPEQNCDGR